MSKDKKRFFCPRCLLIQIILLTILGILFGFHGRAPDKQAHIEMLKEAIQDQPLTEKDGPVPTPEPPEPEEENLYDEKKPEEHGEQLFDLPPLVLPEKAAPPAWQRNAVTADTSGKIPVIAIVIDDLGMDRVNTRRTTRLPGLVTMAFLPYAEELERQTADARAAGHELLVHMPMEPKGHDNPGPNALLAGLSKEEFRARLEKNLNAFTGYVGINNHMGSKLTENPAAMQLVMETLEERGLLYLDSRTTGGSVAESTAQNYGVPAISRDVFLDHYEDEASVHAALKQVEDVALKHGQAIAIGHPKDYTLTALEQWMPDVQKRGFMLVPISALVKKLEVSLKRQALNNN